MDIIVNTGAAGGLELHLPMTQTDLEREIRSAEGNPAGDARPPRISGVSEVPDGMENIASRLVGTGDIHAANVIAQMMVEDPDACRSADAALAELGGRAPSDPMAVASLADYASKAARPLPVPAAYPIRTFDELVRDHVPGRIGDEAVFYDSTKNAVMTFGEVRSLFRESLKTDELYAADATRSGFDPVFMSWICEKSSLDPTFRQIGGQPSYPYLYELADLLPGSDVFRENIGTPVYARLPDGTEGLFESREDLAKRYPEAAAIEAIPLVEPMYALAELDDGRCIDVHIARDYAAPGGITWYYDEYEKAEVPGTGETAWKNVDGGSAWAYRSAADLVSDLHSGGWRFSEHYLDDARKLSIGEEKHMKALVDQRRARGEKPVKGAPDVDTVYIGLHQPGWMNKDPDAGRPRVAPR